MSFHRERIQGAGAIAAAARPPRSAPSKIVRPWRALGDSPSAQPCRLTVDTIRMPDGSVQKVNYRSVASMPWCSGVAPTAASPLTVRAASRLQAAQLSPVTLGPGLPSAGTSPVTSPVVAPTSGGRSTGLVPIGPKPAPSSSPSASPSTSTPSSSSSSSPSSTPTIIVTAPSTTNVAPPRVVVTTNVPTVQTTVAPAPSPYVSSPAIDLSVLTTPAPRKVPWVAIGLGVLGLAILLRK